MMGLLVRLGSFSIDCWMIIWREIKVGKALRTKYSILYQRSQKRAPQCLSAPAAAVGDSIASWGVRRSAFREARALLRFLRFWATREVLAPCASFKEEDEIFTRRQTNATSIDVFHLCSTISNDDGQPLLHNWRRRRATSGSDPRSATTTGNDTTTLLHAMSDDDFARRDR